MCVLNYKNYKNNNTFHQNGQNHTHVNTVAILSIEFGDEITCFAVVQTASRAKNKQVFQRQAHCHYI